jgi:hypothetical protein
VTYVALFDQTSKTVTQTWNMPALGSLSADPYLSVVAWAFAHYGGKLYAFVTTADVIPGLGEDTSTEDQQVYVLDPSSASNSGTRLLDHTGKVIVGAGVSTCAPITIN